MGQISNLLIFLYFNPILFNVMSAIGVRVGLPRLPSGTPGGLAFLLRWAQAQALKAPEGKHGKPTLFLQPGVVPCASAARALPQTPCSR